MNNQELSCIRTLEVEIEKLRKCEVGLKSYTRIRVVCPSQEFSVEEMNKGVARWLSVVRGLWESLSIAKDNDLKIVMLLAPSIDPAVGNYLRSLCLDLGLHENQWRQRHLLIQIDDYTEKHLSEKLLGKDELLSLLKVLLDLERERGTVVEPMSCFATSPNMVRLAAKLGLTIGEVSVEGLHWGTKLGSRKIFDEAGIPFSPGSSMLVKDPKQLMTELVQLSIEYPQYKKWIIKLNSGYGSGHGNGIVARTTTPGFDIIKSITFSECSMTWEKYISLLKDCGAIIEAYIEPKSEVPNSFPSAQCYLEKKSPLENISFEILGTHDQILGGSLGQDFEGCTFPASVNYRYKLMEYTKKILNVLINKGVTGHLSIDFLAQPEDQSLLALEINLRQTGTTHPCRTFHNLLDGKLCDDGSYIDSQGRHKYYFATDGFIDTKFIGISPAVLIQELYRNSEINFCNRRKTGVVPHLWSSLENYGKIGVTCIGDTPEQCMKLKSQFHDILKRLSKISRNKAANQKPIAI